MTRTGFNWLDDLSPTVRNAVLARSSIRSLQDGTLIYRQGDTTTEFFQVLHGEIRKFVLNEQGQEVLIYLYGPGDIVGDSATIDRDPFPVSISTRGETKLRVWSVSDFAQMRAAYPEIDAALALQSSRRLRALLVVIQDLITLPVAARIASRIAALAEVHEQSPDGVALGISQSDLSLMAGSTRQSVNNVVHELKASGLIEASYGRIFVKDLAGLRRYIAAHTRKP